MPNFDSIARPYRWLEYATLGRSLERTRERFLPVLLDCQRALILGDGDGRFTARLMTANPHIQVEAVDISAAMLHLLTKRAPNKARLRIHQASAITYIPAIRPDLIATHFFLDCLTQDEVDDLIARLANELQPGGLWVVSEFRVPPGLMRIPASLVVRALYLAFRILTGLNVKQLPDYTTAMTQAGLTRPEQAFRLGGLLVSELWAKPPK